MQCLRCRSTHVRKNGKKASKPNYICAQCGRQFIDSYDLQGYSEEMKHECERNVCEWSRFSSYRMTKKYASSDRNNLGKENG